MHRIASCHNDKMTDRKADHHSSQSVNQHYSLTNKGSKQTHTYTQTATSLLQSVHNCPPNPAAGHSSTHGPTPSADVCVDGMPITTRRRLCCDAPLLCRPRDPHAAGEWAYGCSVVAIRV
mmetsp:Transcript_10592/g.25722  ORF Transcript_10592/g.25722 Transcript_10592/m.25722 type:complete len:120 (-) Transcript_10592:355-714(-)